MVMDKRGDDLGKRMNDWYTWCVCPDCGKGRYIIRCKLNLAQFTGRCQHCNALWNHPRTLRGSNHHKWNGGKTSSRGYVYVVSEGHPARTKQGKYVKRARLALEKELGRYLMPNYVVHHINGIRGDDRPENLLELSKSDHTKLHNYLRKYRQVVE